MTPGQRLRQIANLLNGSTLLGLLLAACARTPVSSGPRGLLIASRLPLAAALCRGLHRGQRGRSSAPGRNPPCANPVLLGHEERHSTQYAWCLGLPFLPLYFIAAGWSLWRTGNPGSANFFERHAGLQAGGYPRPGLPGTRPRNAPQIGRDRPRTLRGMT